ncbi:MAG: MotA/TolQ/ExbB proton channel family protein [Planctomycetota bacterium]
MGSTGVGSLAAGMFAAGAGVVSGQEPPPEPSTPPVDLNALLTAAGVGEDTTTVGLIVVLAPFAIASLIAVWFSVERLVSLSRRRVIPPVFARRILGGLSAGTMSQREALIACDRDGSVAAAVFAEAIRRAGRPAAEIEKAVADAGERQVLRLRRNMRAINGVATITPLMGLLGTVLGMMISFVEIAGGDGVGRTEELAVGIVTALSTTALGLAIAIPALIVYLYLMSRVERLVAEVDEEARHLVDVVCGENVYGAAQPAPGQEPADKPTSAADRPEPAPAKPRPRRTTPLEIPAGG